MNCDGDDSFSFVLLRDITNGTVITFAESGWLSAGGFRGGGDGSEGAVTWTASSDLTCGTEISITSNGTATSTGSVSLSGSWALSTGGDQILAYQGAWSSPTFIYALNNEAGGVWQADATSTNNSALPTGLTNGTNAVAITEADDIKYDCSTTTPVAATLVAISTSSNWLSSSSAYAIPINCGFTCAAACTGPTTQATFTSITAINSTDFTINFGAGTGGNGRIVVIREAAAVASSPTSGTTYTANTVFGSGTDISGGSGEYVVYDGTGTSVTVTGLTSNTTYYVAIFEYVTGGGTDPCYDASTTGNTGNATTLCGLASEPTTASSAIVFSNIACTSIDIDWTSGNGSDVIVIASTNVITGTPSDQTAYTASATFGSGDILNAGEFVVYNGSGSSVSLSSLIAGTTYYIEIFDYNGTGGCTENYLTSASPTDDEPTLAVCTDPELTAILVDACGGTVEGINEFFTFSNGNTDFEIDSLNVNYPFNGPYCNTTCASGFVTNPTYVAQLNTDAGCAGLFVEADPIPANAKVIVFTGALPTFAFDFSGLCGTGPYYAVFTDNASTTGRFANYNATCADRTLTVDFGALYTDAVTYDRCLLSNTDGDYVSFAADGTPSYSNDGCSPTATLPVMLLNFSGYGDNAINYLNWTTQSEINNDYFSIERSGDGYLFNSIGTALGNGTSTFSHDYSFIDESPLSNLNYYRLKQFDFNGGYSYSNTIVVKNQSNDFSIWYTDNSLHIMPPENNTDIATITIHNTVGQIIYTSSYIDYSTINTQEFPKGIYLVQVRTKKLSIIKKIKF